MKILFISPRPFGLMGTPGTYHLVGAYARHATVRVIASDKKDANVSIVHRAPAGLDLHEVAFGTPGYAKHIAEIAKEFDPDIVCLGNYHGWFEIVERVKKDLPNSKYVLDIKSPLISEENSARRTGIQTKGAEHAYMLDLIVTRCTEDVESWIPKCDRPIYIYPLGVKLSQFAPHKRQGDKIGCTRFVFIGSYSKNRKLDKLLGFIANLPANIISGIVVDMYGSGPEKEGLLELVHQRGLTDIVHIYDGKPQDELLALLPSYDAGIGWVPKEIYDAAPSLKVLEYLGSGLVPIMSATQGHMRNIEDGFSGIVFEENSESFAKAMEQACQQGFSVDAINENLRLIARRDWDAVATQYLIPAFRSLLAGSLPAAPEIPVAKQRRAAQSKLRILLISPRPFGLMGTPGTYHLAEAYGCHAEVCVIANKATTQAVRIVHQASKHLQLHEIAFQTRRYLNEIAKIALEFRPDIVWIGNFNFWPDLVVRLKKEMPDTRFVLDVKSPLLTGEEHERRLEIQKTGMKYAGMLDLVIGLSAEDVETWMPGYSGRLMLYPLGVKISQFSSRTSEDTVVKPKKFVFIGSYQTARKLDVLLDFFAALPKWLREQITLDMYGDGPDKARLEDIVKLLKLQDRVHVHDCLNQDELFKILPEFDAGIGWVPRELYDAAPPLKTLEFMGAGLIPIVTESTAHARYRSEGFDLPAFAEDRKSFCEAIKKVFSEGFPVTSLKRNKELLAYRDFDHIVLDRHLPAYKALLENRVVSSGSQAGFIAPSPGPAVPKKTKPCEVKTKHAAPELRIPAGKQIGQYNYASSLERVLLWAPDISPFSRPLKRQTKTLRVGFIGTDRLFHGLRDEVELLLLQPETWQTTLRYGQLDFILVESTWFTSTSDWYMAQSSHGEGRKQLDALVSLARELAIPAIYWLTLDNQYLPLYEDFFTQFDKIFCADKLAVNALARKKIKASLLEPAFQPQHFNPIRPLGADTSLQPGFIYDGWADLFRYPGHHAVLRKLGTANISVIETSCMMAKLQVERIHDKALQAAIKGWVPRHVLPEIYKRGTAYISFSSTHVTPTEAAWSLLEAAACRVTPVHLGKLHGSDFRKHFVREWHDADSFVTDLQNLAANELMRDKTAHLAWREAHSRHTFAHRIGTICDELGLEHRPNEDLPKATLVTGTMRLQLLEKCIKQYLDQTYPNKELILVYNGAPDAIEHLKLAYADRSDIIIAAIPTDHFAASLLNFGAMNASGDYFFRVDDDDHYGDNYISDSLLYMQAYDADIFGKRASFFHFEGEDKVFLRKDHLPEIACFPASKLHATDKTLISGCSFACKTELLRTIRYPDQINLSADTELIARIKDSHPDRRCLIIDNLNLVVERFADVRKHTWQQSSDTLKKTSTGICENISEIMI